MDRQHQLEMTDKVLAPSADFESYFDDCDSAP